MADDLGARLVQAGLVTPAQLHDALGAAPPHEGALVRALVSGGVQEDAIAGFFVAIGFGPLVDAAQLARAEPVDAVSGRMACELVALPLRWSDAGLIVAMAAPTDLHALGELRRAVRVPVVPTVARASELEAALRRRYPDEGPPSEPARPRSEPPVLELVRRRRHDEAQRIERFVGALEEEGVVPLVRQKPLGGEAGARPRYRSRNRVITKSFEEPSAPPPARATPTRSIIPREHARWDLGDSPAPPVRPRSVAPPGRPPPIGAALAAIRASRDRDEVVELACGAARTVCRAAVLLALRKGVLQGWDGAGPSLTRDAVRNLWIPTHSPSMFRDVVALGEPYEGPPSGSAADALFRAAVGSRGGHTSVHPVSIGGKVVAVLAADEVSHGVQGKERIEILARAAGVALQRIIVESKRR